MKQNCLLLVLIASIFFIGCSDDDGVSYPDSDMPEIIVERDQLYSIPNRKFVIKADLKDDLGLKSLKIEIPEFSLDKEIQFPTSEILTEYQLAYEFLAPAETKKEEKYKVNLILTDVSNNVETKELTLNLDGDFDAPTISNLKPIDGSVFFLSDEMDVNIAFDVTDITGIDYVEIKIEKLNISEKISLEGVKEYKFDKTYTIPSELDSYELAITVCDLFLEPNEATKKINFTVADGLSEMFLADVPLGTDLTQDIFGLPMYYHSKQDDKFTFKYYADTDNKEIYFLGQETSFEPHCFGTKGDSKLENSVSASPITLAEKGYYEIVVDASAMTYTATKYTPVSPVHNPSQITICGAGMEKGGWDPNNKDLLLNTNPDNPYQLQRTLVLDGKDVQMTITSPDWGSPWWRLEAMGIAYFLGGGNHSYKSVTGTYLFTLDTELERAFLVKK